MNYKDGYSDGFNTGGNRFFCGKDGQISVVKEQLSNEHFINVSPDNLDYARGYIDGSEKFRQINY